MREVRLATKNDCCGCEACYAVCGKSAISMENDGEGFAYPVINEKKCIGCLKCQTVCPVLEKNEQANQGHNAEIYAAYLSDSEMLLKASSGGMATAFMEQCLENGYAVFGVRYDDDYKGAHYAEMECIDELASFRGTKYIQSKKGNIYRIINERLREGKKVLFIGLPCEVAALKSFLQGKDENLFTIELICHGATSPQVSDEYITTIEKRYASRVVDFSVRHKKYGWVPPCINVKFENGKRFTKLFDSTEYGYAFRKMSRLSCYNCLFKGDNRVADITIGDYWGAKEDDDCWNSRGVSVVFVHTEKGCNEFLQLNDIMKFSLTYEQAIVGNSMINKSRNDNGRSAYVSIFEKQGLKSARKNNETKKEFIIRILRNMYYAIKKKVM